MVLTSIAQSWLFAHLMSVFWDWRDFHLKLPVISHRSRSRSQAGSES